MNPAERAAHAVARQMGGGVQHSGGDWRVRCPVHDGEDRNLSIGNGSKGADIVVRCFSHEMRSSRHPARHRGGWRP